MKIVAWLFITLPIIYFVALAAVITHHYIVVGSSSENTWVFGSQILAVATIASVLSILVGIGLMKANK